MTINLHLPSHVETLRPKITVVGVGGAGGNAVNNMISANLEGVDFVIANTDAQALESAQTDRVIQLGINVTRGLGAGAKPEVGSAAAEEAQDEIADNIQGSNMVFITAGMGGGTGTGAAPIIARLAKEQGMLTVGVVTKPFQFEGAHRMKMAEAGIRELQQYVDTLIVVPNQNLFRIANEKTTFAEAFRLADEVLHSGVRGVTDLIVKPGLVNLDFADIRAVMSEMGKAMMGTGEASGDQRALQASEAAISNPLLDDVSLKGARAVLVNITGGQDMSLFEVDEAVNRIRDEVDADANIIFGSTFSDSMEGRMRVSVVATGIDAAEMQRPPQSDSSGGMTTTPGRKYYGAPAPTSHSVRKETLSAPSPSRERSPAEIVRQAGTSAINEALRATTPSTTGRSVVTASSVSQASAQTSAPQPIIRIIDESVREDEVKIVTAEQTYASNAVQVEQAVRMAANSSRTVAASAMPVAVTASAAAEAQAAPFVSPRAEAPQQRTLFTAQEPEMEEMAEEASAGRGLFNRLANVGKSIGSGTRASIAHSRTIASAAPAPVERKAEVRESAPHTNDEDELYDIPAFLRRQAN